MPWALLLLGSLVGLGLLGSPVGLKPQPIALFWAGCALSLELAAPHLPRFGFASTAAGLWLGLAYQFPNMLWLAALGASVAVLLRVVRSRQSSSLALIEALAEVQPLLLALGLSRALGSPALMAPLWFLLWWLQPAYMLPLLDPEVGREWSLVRARLVRLGLVSALLGALTTWTSPSAAVPALLALALFSTASSVSSVVRSLDAENQTVTRRQQQRGLEQREVGLEKLEKGLLATDKKQRQQGTELEVRLQTYQLIDEMLESIPERPLFDSVAEMVVQRLQQRFNVANVVLFWLDQQRLVPSAWVSNHGDRIASSQLTQQSEPSVARAMESSVLHTDSSTQGSHRLFPDDLWTVAVPLPGRGCFYLGNPYVRNLSEEDVHFLEVLARHSVLALDAALWYQTLQTSLQREAATAARNEALVQRLALVIDGVTQLLRLREPQAMLDSAGRILAPLVPHRLYFAQTGAGAGAGARELIVQQGEGALPPLQALARKVCEQNLPLLLDQPHRLAVPLMSERGPLGSIVLERDEPAFTREDQDILSVLSYQLGSALVNAKLYAELQKTHEALRDSQAQLMQSSKMAAVGQLAGGVAHELNTPLGAVSLAIEAAQLNLENKPDRAAARLQRATKAVGQMKEIVSKLLFYSRDARSGWREADLNQVIEDTLQLVGHQLRLDNIEVVQQRGEVPSILANANEIQQVLTNLVLNARDAMLSPGASGKQLHLSTGVWEGGVWVKVRDQGSGISAEVAERIFEPFFTTKEVGKGTGLGLSVTAQLVQQHGGTIQVHSQPGQGAEFEVRLPMAPPGEG
jgi:signal transduction histidine kinase